MSTIQPDSYFDALEVQFNDLALAVATGDAETLPALSEQIQKTAVSLAGVWQQWQRQGLVEPGIPERVKALAEGLQIVRSSLLRRAMLVEQALNLVVPASVDPTYAGGGNYGAGPKSSGRLAAVSA